MINNNIWHAKAPTWVIELLKNCKTGTVSMRNSSGMYISVGGEMILICDSKWGTVPCGISIHNYDAFLQSYGIYENMLVSFFDNTITLPSGDVNLDLAGVTPDHSINMPSKEDFDNVLSVLRKSAKTSGLARLGEMLFCNKDVTDNIWCERALPKLKKLITALKEDNATIVYDAANSLLGLGLGLTPSGDDVLAGMYYGLSHSSLCSISSISSLLHSISNAKEKTTPVSASFLKAISKNAPFDILNNAWHNSYCADRLVEVGNHSGTEMLLGLLCAMSIIFSKS